MIWLLNDLFIFDEILKFVCDKVWWIMLWVLVCGIINKFFVVIIGVVVVLGESIVEIVLVDDIFLIEVKIWL